MLKQLPILLLFLASLSILPAFSQDKSKDILLISVGESSSRYSDVATHLEGLFTNTPALSETQVELLEDSDIESLADGYYDQNPEDIALREKVSEGFGSVILIPTINTTPTGTIEYREFGNGPQNVYDDAPLDNEYFAPEVFYEGCAQLSKLILSSGSTPIIFLPQNADENVTDFGPVMYRVANGVGMDLIPGAYALAASSAATDAEEDYLYACSIFTQVTGLNATASTYSPAGIANETALANTAESTVNLHKTTTHYSTSYENEGAVVYRNLDITSAPFNDVIRYMYKGSSTHDWTKDALNKIISSNSATTAASRKLGTRNGFNSTGVRFWHPDDIGDQGSKFSLEPDEAAFMYVSGSWAGADAQTVIDLDQENMIPMAFDWIKSFAISPAVSGTASTLDALDYHSCVELYFNYAERGWKLIPLTIGMGRLNEAVPNFVASDDALHSSDPLVYMNAYMMLSSALGTQVPLPINITAADIHRGSYTTEEIQEACLIGHDVIKELAYLSETGDFVPDSDLAIVTDELPEVLLDQAYSHQLSASGGDTTYTWELISESELPDGLSLSNTGLISGTITAGQGTKKVAFKVTDGTGAFKKIGLKLVSPAPTGSTTLSTQIFAEPNKNYGTDTVAIMSSDLFTAPDGLATYRLAIHVTPTAGTSITSQGGSLWGVNSGEGASGWWSTFDGSLSQSIDSISNIHITDFNANGGELTTNNFTNFSFKSVAIHNANNSADRVKITADGVVNNANGVKMGSSPQDIDLQAIAGTNSVSSFTLANGNIGNSKDRWNIGGIEIDYTINLSNTDGYAAWAAQNGLAGDQALPDADPENDGYANLLEFALGMNPNQPDAGTKESSDTEQEAGSTYFFYQYERRTDHLALGLSYDLIETVDLITPIAESAFDVTVGSPINGFETVTTRYLVGDPLRFIQLKVQLDSN